MVLSAGLLLFRPRRDAASDGPEVFIAHMGGPFWRSRPRAWSIPKGEVQPGERPLDTARREFAEEIGVEAPSGGSTGPVDLGEFRQSSKTVQVFAVPALGFEVDEVRSNTVDIELPRGSGRFVAVPEVDDARWTPVAEARSLVVLGQVAALDALVALVRTAPA